jgi:hypothetical protein
MATKTKEIPVSTDPNLKLAGKEWNECAGQPLVEIKLPVLEADESGAKPDQVYRYTIVSHKSGNNVDYQIVRGRKTLIPRDHFLVLYNSMPEIL